MTASPVCGVRWGVLRDTALTADSASVAPLRAPAEPSGMGGAALEERAPWWGARLEPGSTGIDASPPEVADIRALGARDPLGTAATAAPVAASPVTSLAMGTSLWEALSTPLHQARACCQRLAARLVNAGTPSRELVYRPRPAAPSSARRMNAGMALSAWNALRPPRPDAPRPPTSRRTNARAPESNARAPATSGQPSPSPAPPVSTGTHVPNRASRMPPGSVPRNANLSALPEDGASKAAQADTVGHAAGDGNTYNTVDDGASGGASISLVGIVLSLPCLEF